MYQIFKIPRILFLAAVMASVSLNALAASDVKETMKHLKVDFNAASSSRSIAELKPLVEKLRVDADKASKLRFPDNQPAYDEGMKTLLMQIARLNEAVQANDMHAARQILDKINQDKKHYHHVLN